MIVYLNQLEFENDMVTIPLVDGTSLIITKIDECFTANSEIVKGKIDISIHRNVILSRYDYANDTVSILSTVINSIQESNIQLKSEYSIVNEEQLAGQMLTLDNMEYCYLDINDDGLLEELANNVS